MGIFSFSLICCLLYLFSKRNSMYLIIIESNIYVTFNNNNIKIF